MASKKVIIRAISAMLSIYLTFTCSFAFATDSMASSVVSDQETSQSEPPANSDQAENGDQEIKEMDEQSTPPDSGDPPDKGIEDEHGSTLKDESLASTSSSNTVTPNNEENTDLQESIHEATRPSLLDDSGIITATNQSSEDKMERSLPSDSNFTELGNPGRYPTLAKKDLEKAIALNKNARLATDVTTVENTINETDGMDVYFPLNLNPGLIMRFVMECPDDPSLDYDLHLYQYDESTDALTWLDSSTYATYFNTDSHGKRKTLDESLSYINNTSSTVTYALAVSAKVGYSTTKPYRLHMQLATAPDGSAEPNDSAYHAIESSFGPDSPLLNQELDASMDQDWYRIGILSSLDKDYDYVNVYAPTKNSNSFFDIEFYQADGQKMCLVSPTQSTATLDKYELGVGYYYVKVFNYQFASSNSTGYYDINIDKKGYVDKFNVKFLVDLDPPMQTGYPEGKNYWFEHTFTAEVHVFDKWDNPVVDEPVSVTWMSRMWPQNPEREVTLTGLTDKQGICRLEFNPLVEPGTLEHTITNGHI